MKDKRMSSDPFSSVPDELKNLLAQITSEEMDESNVSISANKKVNDMPSYIAEMQSPAAK